MALNLLGLQLGGSRLGRGLPSTSGDPGTLRAGRLGRLATALLRRVPFAGRLLSGRKRGREEFEAPDEGAGPEPGQEEGEEEVGELRAALERAEAALAAERALDGGAFAYAYPEVQVPAALRAPASVAVQTEGVGGAPGPRGERARLREAIGEAERARRRCAERRTGVFVAAEGAAGAEAAEAAGRRCPTTSFSGRAEGALPEAHRLLCAAGRVCRRWRRLASDPRLWSSFHLRAHALQLPSTSSSGALRRRPARPGSGPVAAEIARCLAALAAPGAGGAGAGPPPLPRVAALELRIFRARPYPVPVPERLPWLPACSGDQLRALGAGFRGSRSEAFASTARLLRVAERFPGLRRLSLPGEGRGYFPAIKSLGGPSSRIEELDLHIAFSECPGRKLRIHRAFPRLRWLRSASVETQEGLERMLQLAPTPAPAPAAEELAPGPAPAPARAIDRLKISFITFDRETDPLSALLSTYVEPEPLRACVEHLQPRALLFESCMGLHLLQCAIGPSVQELLMDTGSLISPMPGDMEWIPGFLSSVRELSLNLDFDDVGEDVTYGPYFRRFGELLAAPPALRRVVLTGYDFDADRLGGAARLAELRGARSLGPVVFEERGDEPREWETLDSSGSAPGPGRGWLDHELPKYGEEDGGKDDAAYGAGRSSSDQEDDADRDEDDDCSCRAREAGEGGGIQENNEGKRGEERTGEA
eukprot:tig00000523_g1829.t1